MLHASNSFFMGTHHVTVVVADAVLLPGAADHHLLCVLEDLRTCFHLAIFNNEHTVNIFEFWRQNLYGSVAFQNNTLLTVGQK